MSDMRTLVMVPTYNERENVEVIVKGISSLNLDLDLLFVDDNSPDGTGDLLDKMAADNSHISVLHRTSKQGIGTAHKAGIAWAYEHGYQRLLTMDSDLSHSPSDIPRMLFDAKGADVVVGSRYLRKGGLKDWTWTRKFMTYAGDFLTTTLLRLPQDCTNAFRHYRLDRIPSGLFEMVTSPGYSFFYESLHRLNVNGFSISEIPIDLPARTYGHSKMRLTDMFYSVKYLCLLNLRTTFNRESLIYVGPYQGADTGENAQGAWDSYWSGQGHEGKWLYDFIAIFYRRFIIRPAVNHFLDKSFAVGSKILHAGCGSGMVDTDASHRFQITGLDISTRALTEFARYHGAHAKMIHGSLFAIPTESAAFDGAFNLGVMEHFTEKEVVQILRELHRVVKPGGRIVLFWPPIYGLATQALKLIHRILRGFKKNIQLHPDEITYVRSRQQVDNFLKLGGFALEMSYFGIRDFFTHQIIVARRVN